MRIWQAVGFTIGFVIAELLSFQHRVWVLLGTVVIAAIVNLILEFTTQSREELLPCVYHKRRGQKSCSIDSESSNTAATIEEGGNTSSPKSDVSKEPAVSELTQDLDHSNGGSIGQNPIFIMYGGRRPSAMSMWSADSLDGTLPSTDSTTCASATDGGGALLQQNCQNPLFVMYNGRRPSTDSINSYKGVSSFVVDLNRRPSAVSTFSADSLDGTRPLILSSDSDATPFYPPLTITTVPYVSSDTVPVRVLSPIHECEDDNNEEHPAVIKENSSASSTTIQRSNSYLAALNDAVAVEYSKC